jgi:hypothetical protein
MTIVIAMTVIEIAAMIGIAVDTIERIGLLRGSLCFEHRTLPVALRQRRANFASLGAVV